MFIPSEMLSGLPRLLCGQFCFCLVSVYVGRRVVGAWVCTWAGGVAITPTLELVEGKGCLTKLGL